jgi:hypothetical protein
VVIDLATRARRGEQQAWDALVERYSPADLVHLPQAPAKLSDADAEDAGQSVWLLLAQQLVASGRAGALNCGHGHRAIFEIYRIQKICAVAAPHVAASHRHSSDCAAVLPVRETGQQWPMSKLFGAAVTTADVLR